MTMPEPSSIKRHSIDAGSEYERDSNSQEVPHTYSRSNGVPRSVTQSYPSYDYSHEPYGPGLSIAVHPLSYSEANPTAPVGHIIHQPYQSPRFSPIESETYRFNAGFDAPDPQDKGNRSSTLLQARNRCVKKIGQRRDSIDDYAPADQAISRRTSSSMEVKGSPSIIKAEESDPRLPDAMIRAGPPRHRTFHAPTVSSKPRPSQNYREMEAAAPETVPQAAQNTIAKIKSVPISGLISAEDAPYKKSFPGPAVFTPTEPPLPTYRMDIRQQPIAARACGFGERDRRVIDPPPILQMVMVGGDEGTKTTYPCGVVHATLWHADKEMDDTMMPETGDRRQQRRLMGSGVASPFIGKDEHDVEGCFFTFSDLSCRTSGRYRLRFVLVIVDPENMGPGSRAAFQSVVISDVFQVYAAKDFPGMRTSTELTKRLKEQGCLISVKKGNEKALEGPGKGKKATHIRDDSDEEEDDDNDDDDDDDEDPKSKGRKTKKQKK